MIKAIKLGATRAVSEGELFRLLNEYEGRGEVELRVDGKIASVRLMRVGSSVRADGEALIADPNVGREAASAAFLELESPIFQSVISGDADRLIEWFEGLSKVRELDLISKVAESVARDLAFSYESAYSRFQERQRDYLELESDLQERIKSIDEEQSDLISNPDYMIYEEISRQSERALERIKERRSLVENKKKELLVSLIKKQADIARLSREISDLKVERAKLERSIRRVEEEVETSKHRINELESQHSEISNKIREIVKEMEGHFEETPRGKIKIPGIRDRIAEISDRLTKREREMEQPRCEWCGLPIKEKVKCPNCGYEFSLAGYVAQEVEELKEEIAKLEALQRRLSLEKVELEARKKRIEAELRYIRGELKGELNKYYSELERIKREIRSKERKLKEAEHEIAKMEEDKRGLERELEELREEEEAVLQEKFKTFPPDKAVRLENIRKRVKELENRRESLEEQLLTVRARMEQLADQEMELRMLEKKARLAEEISKYFSHRAEIVKIELVNEVNKKLREYFDLLRLAQFEDIRLDLSDRRIILLRPEANRPTPLTSLSDAEKGVLASILSYIIKKVVAPNLKIFAIDTISELLDDTRIQRLLERLNEEALRDGEIVIVSRLEPFNEKREIISQKNIIKFGS